MSSSDLEVVRDQYEAVNERDFERAMSHYAENVELVSPDEPGWFSPGTYKGREAVGRWFGDWFSSFGADMRFEIKELRELDDGSILVVADNYGRGRASGVEVTWQVIWTYRLRDGKVVHLEAHPARADALRAAGMEK